MSTAPVKSSTKYCSLMPVEIYLSKCKAAEPEYQTIEKDQLTDEDDAIAETVVGEDEDRGERRIQDGDERDRGGLRPRNREDTRSLKRPVPD